MAEVVIKIPKDLEQEFGGVKSIFWQLAVGRVINEELERLRRLKQIVSKSKLAEKDVEELSNEVTGNVGDGGGDELPVAGEARVDDDRTES